MLLQEQPHESKEKLDDDEDRKNPAYVPRRGMFYEHDQRNSVGDNEAGEKERCIIILGCWLVIIGG